MMQKENPAKAGFFFEAQSQPDLGATTCNAARWLTTHNVAQ